MLRSRTPLPRFAAPLAGIFVLATLVPASGCFLPVATGAPQKAETVGQGRYGTSFSSEVPNLNLTAEDSGSGSGGNPEDLVIAPAASMSFGLQYGVHDAVDLELTVDGALYLFLLPLPLGVSGGVRAHAFHRPGVDVAVAGRIGWLGLSNSDNDDPSAGGDEASATYGQGSVVIQVGGEALRPALALSFMPVRVRSSIDGVRRDYDGMAVSATVSLHIGGGRVSVAPYVAFNHFASADVAGETFVSGGIAWFFGDRGAPAPAASPPSGGVPGAPGAPAPTGPR